MSYKIIIPSFQRYETIIKKTLKCLSETNVDTKNIYIFVSSEEEKQEYSKSFLFNEFTLNIIVGLRGIPQQRNFIQNYFPEGENLFMIDDDISKIVTIDESGKKAIPLKDLDGFLNMAFEKTEQLGLKMWGVQANPNPLNMDKRISVGLIYLVGNFIGLINVHNKSIYVDEGETIPSRAEYKSGKESHERALKHYKTYGGVVKFKHVGLESKYWKEPGGHQVSRTVEGEKEASEILMKQFPGLLSYREVNGVPDVTFVGGKTKTYSLNDKLVKVQHSIQSNNLFSDFQF